jgi:hypothetical protein
VRALNAQYRAYQLLERQGAEARPRQGLKDLEVQAAPTRSPASPSTTSAIPSPSIAFRDADEVLERYKALKIAKADKPAEFKKSLQEKRTAKDAVDKAYTTVVKLKSPEWAVASLFRIGEASANLVKVIKDVPAPKGLTEEQASCSRTSSRR